MTFQEMFENAKKSLLKAKKIDAANHIAVQFNVTGEASGIFYVEAAEGKLHVEPYTYDDRDAVLTADSVALLEALKTADTAALQMEGDADKIAAFRVILESLPKPRKTSTKTAAAKKTTAAAKKTSAAKTEAAAKPAAKTKKAAAESTKKAASEKKTTAKAATSASTATVAATATKPAAKKTTKK